MSRRASFGTSGPALRMAGLILAVVVGTACSTVRIVYDEDGGRYQPKKCWTVADLLEGVQGETLTFKNVSGDTVKVRFDKCCVQSPLTLELKDGEKGTVKLRTSLPSDEEDCPDCACHCCNYLIEGPRSDHGAPTMIVKEGP